MLKPLIYLDLCCYKRPFDDQGDPRIRREAESVAFIIEAGERGKLRLISSPALIVENEVNPREDRRLAASVWLDRCSRFVAHADEVEDRSKDLVNLGLRPLDAYHLAYAEAGGAQYFVTVDRRLIRRVKRVRETGKKVHIEVVTPGMCLSLLEE